MTKYVCHICKKIMDKHQYDSHLMGQKHLKNVEKIRIESQTSNIPINSSSFLLPSVSTCIPSIKNVCTENSENVEFVSEPNGWFFCNLCQIPCNSHDSLTDHLKGIKHLKKRNIESHVCQQMLTNSNNLAGREFIEAECHTEVGKAIQYKCNLCCCEVTEGSLVSHLKGRRHKQNYKQQVDSSVTVGPKSPMRTMKKMLKNLEKKQVKELFWRNKDDHLSIRRKRTFEKFDKLYQSDNDADDDFNECIMKKYKLIAMEPTILQVLLWFCNCCESTLKLVSDEFVIRDGHDDEDDSKRTLRGTMRVGVLGNRQFLKGDKNFDLVLVLSTKVSLSLLETMRDCLSSKLRSVMFGHEFEKDADFIVKMKPEMPCLEVSMVRPFTFDVVISVVSSHLEKVDVKEEGDYLNVNPGMASLKQLIRADWFQTRLNYANEGLKVLMVLRQLKSEDDVWNILGDWVNEVLIEKCTFIQSFTSTPSSVMRCYLELLSSGLLLDGSGLRDPCENELADLFKNLTAQQKENITRHAQKCLRLLALKKSHIFLKVEACSSKRNAKQD